MNTVIRSFAITLALSAMLLRALLPAGWMPEAGSGTLVICTADGGMAHMPGHAHPLPGRGKDACPFAAVAPLTPAHFAPVALVIPPAGKPTRVAPAQIAVRTSDAYRAQSPRAPPFAV